MYGKHLFIFIKRRTVVLSAVTVLGASLSSSACGEATDVQRVLIRDRFYQNGYVRTNTDGIKITTKRFPFMPWSTLLFFLKFSSYSLLLRFSHDSYRRNKDSTTDKMVLELLCCGNSY